MRRVVFLSSTGKDLAEYRRAVIDHLTRLDHFLCDAQENFGARDAWAVAFCRQRVEASDIFVGLIGHYRGWEPPSDDPRRSITEMEYDWASEEPPKPRLIYVAPDDVRLPGPRTDDADAAERQARFRDRLMSAHIVDQGSFGSAKDLAAAVGQALANHVIGELLMLSAGQGGAARPERDDPLGAAAQAAAQVAEDENIDPAELAGRGIDVIEIEARLKARAEAHQARGREENRASARYYRQIGALAYLHDTQKALNAYAKAAELDPDDAEGWYQLGQVQARFGNLPAAKASFERVLALANSIDDPQMLHWTHMLLGDVEAELGNRPAALDLYDRAVALIKPLAARDPNNAEWQRDLSVSYSKIGDTRSARGDRDGALKAYEDSLGIRKALAARDPNNAERQRDLSVSYDRIGDIGAARGDRDAALKAYEDGLGIAKALAARDPNNAEWQRDLSVSYDRVGDIRAARGDRDGALKAYEDGLGIAKALAARDPNNAEWQRDLSVSYDRVGDTRAARGDRDGALKAYEDALGIAKALAARDRNNAEWQTDLADCAWKLAEAGAPDGCEHLRNGLAILKRLGAEDRLTADQIGWIGIFESAIAQKCG